MTVQLFDPNLLERYVDENGRLTVEGLKLLAQMVAMLKDHESRLAAGSL